MSDPAVIPQETKHELPSFDNMLTHHQTNLVNKLILDLRGMRCIVTMSVFSPEQAQAICLEAFLIADLLTPRKETNDSPESN